MFGALKYLGGQTTINGMILDDVALLRMTQAKSAHVVGISMRRNHAFRLVLDFPELVKSLVPPRIQQKLVESIKVLSTF